MIGKEWNEQDERYANFIQVESNDEDDVKGLKPKITNVAVYYPSDDQDDPFSERDEQSSPFSERDEQSRPFAWQPEDDAEETVGFKYDAGKPRMDLIPHHFIEGVAKVLTLGANKYDPDDGNEKRVFANNWRAGMRWGRCFAACMRHLWAWWGGETYDQESGLSHLYHAAANILFLVTYEEVAKHGNDRLAELYSSHDDRPTTNNVVSYLDENSQMQGF